MKTTLKMRFTILAATACWALSAPLAQAQEILTAHGLEHATVQVEGDQGCGDSELSW